MRARHAVILSTTPSSRAKKLARALVRERLAACVNILPGASSVYRWKGRVEEARESLLVIKTRLSTWPRLEARLRELHPYDVPEILELPIARGSRPYLLWLDSSTGRG
ncbi:MAG: divalent-cation tolerance protein CutA [Candidatus Brocadiae bacterium]|nr:divalent-cation tolerance protein CutA [Candidatus Brocadiia bacterium]